MRFSRALRWRACSRRRPASGSRCSWPLPSAPGLPGPSTSAPWSRCAIAASTCSPSLGSEWPWRSASVWSRPWRQVSSRLLFSMLTVSCRSTSRPPRSSRRWCCSARCSSSRRAVKPGRPSGSSWAWPPRARGAWKRTVARPTSRSMRSWSAIDCGFVRAKRCRWTASSSRATVRSTSRWFPVSRCRSPKDRVTRWSVRPSTAPGASSCVPRR